jgi:steroid delta-isomerase
MSTTCEKTVAEYFAAIRALDVDRFVSTFAPDGVTHDPVGTPPHAGHAGIRPFFSGITAAFTSLNLAEEYFFLNGNSAAVKWNGHAVARTGKTIDFEGIDVLDCNDEGKIVMVRAFWDAGAVMAATQG